MFLFFFFFKQKTAYEIMPSLVGSEMCIRDSKHTAQARQDRAKVTSHSRMTIFQMAEVAVSEALFAALLVRILSLIHISEPTRLGMISYAVFCLKKNKKEAIIIIVL